MDNSQATPNRLIHAFDVTMARWTTAGLYAGPVATVYAVFTSTAAFSDTVTRILMWGMAVWMAACLALAIMGVLADASIELVLPFGSALWALGELAAAVHMRPPLGSSPAYVLLDIVGKTTMIVPVAIAGTIAVIMIVRYWHGEAETRRASENR